MSVWRLQTKTSLEDIGDYCLKNNIIALGWSLKDLNPIQRKSIETFDDFQSFAEIEYKEYGSAKRLWNEVKIDDIVWVRNKGQYYFTLITKQSYCYFDFSTEATSKDASNQIKDIEWIKASAYADESTIPGAIATAFIRGSTLQRIKKTGVESYSQHLYNKLTSTNHYNNINTVNNEKNFYSLLSTNDCEDLLCLWLFYKYNYICIPSTNKKTTELYECILIEPSTGKRVYPQVKKGAININSNDYQNLKGDIWLLTTEGKITGNTKVNIADPEELYKFALDEHNSNILPESIVTWVEFLKKNETV